MDANYKFANAGKPWCKEESDKLINYYNNDKLNLLNISKIHGRTPYGIICRLKQLNIINITQQVRGYQSYINSDYYKYKLNNKLKNKYNQTCDSTNTNFSELLNEVKGLNNNIKELNCNIKELIAIMNAIYEFENS